MSGILVVNAGSTSLKLSRVEETGASTPVASLDDAPRDVDGVAHRIVHGGARFYEPILIGAAVAVELEGLRDLAPLHNGPALAAIELARRTLPGVPHVAVFDTAFHRTMPEDASTFAVPLRWRDEWGIRRYGFHGLSVEWTAEQVAVPRLVVCHLGGGCSVTAVQDGRSVDTTMSFSPLDGVPMATRSGSVDPEVVLHLLRTRKLTLEEIDDALERKSGLVGLSELSGRVEELEANGSPEARLALAVFVRRVAGAAAAMAASLGGLDAIAFTGGVGENSSFVRASVCGRLGFAGVELDPDRNNAARPDAEIGAADSRVGIHVIAAREDLVAARAARRVIQ